MSSAKWRPFCLGPNVLTCNGPTLSGPIPYLFIVPKKGYNLPYHLKVLCSLELADCVASFETLWVVGYYGFFTDQ